MWVAKGREINWTLLIIASESQSRVKKIENQPSFLCKVIAYLAKFSGLDDGKSSNLWLKEQT